MNKRKVLSWVWLASVASAIVYYAVKQNEIENLLIAFAGSMAIGVTIVSFIEVLSDD